MSIKKFSGKSDRDCYTSERKHKVCKIGNSISHALKLIITVLLITTGSTAGLSGQTVLIDPAGAGGFELGNTMALNGWTTVNVNPNNWIVGTDDKYAGTYSAYVSNDGTRNRYNKNTFSTVHFYRDITIPSGEDEISLSFYLLGTGETNWDRLLVYTAPTSVTPVTGTPASDQTTITGATLIFTQSGVFNNYTLQTITLPASLAGTTFRLIFTWQNDDNTGANPGASVDDISLTSMFNYPERYAVADGNWNSASTWSLTSGGAPGASVPGVDDNVYIEGNHTVTLNANTPNLALLDIASGSTLTTTGAYTVTSESINVNGTYINGSTGAITSTTMTVNSGATYRHNINWGSIPTATWHPNSTCLITGITNTLPTETTFVQSFGNFTWNCPSQNTDLSFAASLTNINGNLTINNTGTRTIRLINGGGTSAYTTTVGGNFIQTGGSFFIVGDYFNSGEMTLDVARNFTLSGGTFNICANTRNGSAGQLKVGGNFSLSAGATFTETGGRTANIFFDGTTSQMYTSAATIGGTLNFTVNSGATLQMGTGASPSFLTGTDGTFTVAAGGTLGVTSPAGITTTGATGNIQVTGTRTYTAGANYIYNGTSAQVTGNGLTQNTAAAVTINNGAGVTLSAVTTTSGLLTMTNGTLNMANQNLKVGSLTGSSNITNTTGIAGNRILTVGGDGTTPAAYSGSLLRGTSTSLALTILGPGTLTLSNPTQSFNGVTTITGGELRLNPSSTTATYASQIVLNGGTLSTTGIIANAAVTFAAALNLNASSAITVGANIHSIVFPKTSTQAWAGAALTIKAWGSTTGKVFFGTNTSGLSNPQLLKVAFEGYSGGADILSTGEVKPKTSSIIISSSSPAAASGAVIQGSKNNVIYSFNANVNSIYAAVIAGLKVTTAGAYSVGDIDNLKAWYSADNSFSSASDVLLSTLTSPTGPGSQVFSNWTNQSIAPGATGYFFITADIACSGASNATFNIEPVTTADITMYDTKTGTTSAGGTQTILYLAPVDVTAPSATAGDTKSVLNWAAPVNCYDEIVIIAKANTQVTGIPAGDGSAYTANTFFGSGTAYDGGYVVYKGSVIPQTITGLTNGLTYYFTFFTRKGSTWTSGIITSSIPTASVAGEYQSATSGDWNQLDTWLYYDGIRWYTPSNTEGIATNNNGEKISIHYGHTISVTANVNVDQVVVEAGGKVTVNNGNTLTITDGTGTDFSVSGTLLTNSTNNNSGITINFGAALTFNSGGTYQHNVNGEVIPTATWDAVSTCYITGVTNTLPTNVTQSFGNFNWNCTTQTGNLNLAGGLTTVNGVLTITNTGSGSLTLGDTQSGNLIAGEFLQKGGSFYCSGTNASTSAVARTITVSRDFSLAGGTFNLSNSSTPGNAVTVNIAGNFTQTGGTLTETGATTGSTIRFNGNGTQQLYTPGGTVSGTINYNIASPAYVQMGSGPGPAIMPSPSGAFTIASGATLGVTSPAGITTSGATGNIQVAGARTYSAGANYIYNGTSNQSTGNGLYQNIPGNLTIANTGVSGANTVSLVANTPVSGGISVTNGVFDLSTLTCNRSTSGGTLSVADGASLKIGGTNTMPSNFGTHSLGATSTVEYYGAAQTVYPEIANGYGNLTLSGSGTKTIATGTSVTVQSTLTTGNLLTIQSTSLTSNGSLIVNGTSSGTLTYNRQLRTEGADYEGDYHYVSSPVASNTATNSSKITDVWAWNEVTGLWGTTTMTGLASGVGYNLDQTTASDGLMSFTGTVVTSGFSLTATSPYLSPFGGMIYAGRPYASGRDGSTNWGGGGWNLLGNPFTSAMDATAFVIANSSSFDPSYMTVYVYDGSIGDAGTYYYDFTTVQAGQGFFVLAMNDGVSFNFTPGTSGMQIHDNSSTMLKSTKITSTLPGFDLIVNYGTYKNTARVIYDINMTEGLDPGYDIGQLSAGAGVEVYTTLVQDNGLNFTRQALPLPDGEDNIIAVGVDSKRGGEVIFSADFLTGESYNVILEDRTTGIFTDLGTGTYKVTIPAGTYGTGRFFLHSKEGTATGVDPDPEMLDVRIWSYGKSINVQGTFNTKAKATIYNMNGSMVYNDFLTDGALNTIELQSATRGLYIVVVVDGKDVYKQKVMIL